MRRRRMGAISVGDPRLNLQASSKALHHHAVVVEEIEGLIRVFKDGQVERFPLMPEVPFSCSSLDPDVTSRDLVVDPSTRVWARVYVPAAASARHRAKLPLLVYFHGGGFCVGSAAWRCYHEFLSRLAARAGCLIVSVNYRLAPENRLPTAYDDGLATVKWLRREASTRGGSDESARWWWNRCNFSKVFVGGDSAGATIAHNVATRIGSLDPAAMKPVSIRGVILIQPFFGGEARTASERGTAAAAASSALSLAASDVYWRLALPVGADRDHPWCNPMAGGGGGFSSAARLPPYLVCVAEMDILRDRDIEFCRSMRRSGRSVEVAVHGGVGHAFHVLHSSRVAQARAQEMISQLDAFLNR